VASPASPRGNCQENHRWTLSPVIHCASSAPSALAWVGLPSSLFAGLGASAPADLGSRSWMGVFWAVLFLGCSQPDSDLQQ